MLSGSSAYLDAPLSRVVIDELILGVLTIHPVFPPVIYVFAQVRPQKSCVENGTVRVLKYVMSLWFRAGTYFCYDRHRPA